MITQGKNQNTATISRMVFLDTETTKGEDGLAHLRLGWACMWLKGGEKWHYFTTEDQFWDKLETFIGNKHASTFVYAYNSAFDFQVLGLENAMRRPGWTYERPAILKPFIFQAHRGEHNPVWFLDMGNHVGGKIPLAKIGETMNILKGDLDRKRLDDYPDIEVSKYCKRDVEIVRNYILEWLYFLRENNLGAYRPSLAAQCLTAYRTRFVEQPIYTHDIKPVVALERESYRGGRMECFFIGDVQQKAYKLDVNSFHPYIMRNLPLPYRLRGTLKNPKISALGKILDRDQAFIASGRVVVPPEARMISIRRTVDKVDTNIFPVGTFHAVFTSIDYESLIHYGGKVLGLDRVAIYDKDVLFKSYIDFFYKKRLEFKEAGLRSMEQMAKYFMNSLEGKFAQKVNQTVLYMNPAQHTHNYMLALPDGSSTQVMVYDNKEWITVPTAEESWNTFIPISSFIRSYTRVILWDDMHDIWSRGGKVYYCDTDSIFCDEAGRDALQTVNRISSSALGAYKLEDEGTLSILGAKNYMFNGKRVIKGIREDAEEIAPHVYRQTRFNTMGQMRRKNISCGVEIKDDFIVKLSLQYRKGIVSPSGWVEPFVLNE